MPTRKSTNAYRTEQMDHANRWQTISEHATGGEAQRAMHRGLALSRSTAWRVVEHPSRVLVCCEGGPALSAE